MRLFSGAFWGKQAGRVLRRLGFMKIPSGLGGLTGGGLFGYTSLGSARKQLEAYQNHVYKCVTLIFRRAQDVSMHLFKERGEKDEEIVRHPVLDVLRRPNPYMTGRDLKAITFMHRDLTGKAFWLLRFNGLGRPAEIWPLPVGNFTRLVMDEAKTQIVKYEFRTEAGRPVLYDPEEIVYFRYPHPLYMLEGASPIQAMAFAYDTDMAVRVYQRNFFQNSARPDVLFESEQKIEPDDAKRILLGWKQEHQGVERSWEPAILDQGLKLKILSVLAKDFEFAALAGWTKQDILEAYNVPEGKLGTVKDVNKANALGIDITFNSECIAPRLTSYQEQITVSLLPLYDEGLYAKHANCIPRDLEYELKQRENNLKYFYSSINEERAKDGLDPVAWGEAPWVPISYIQYGETAGIIQETVTMPALLQKGTDRREAARLGHERQVAARSRAYRAWLRKFFTRQKDEVLANLEQHFPRVEGAIAGMSIKKAKKWLVEHKDLVDQICFDLNRANTQLIEGSGPYLEGAITSGGENVLAALEVDIAFDITSPQAVAHLREKAIVLRDVNRVTIGAIRKELLEGFEAGDTMRQMTTRINKVFGNADQVRSLRIAQTEINGSMNFGSLEGYRQSGVVEAKEWLAGPDARDTHQAAAARYQGEGAIPLHEDFQVGAGSGPAPGSIGLPEEDINCRCTISPVVRKD